MANKVSKGIINTVLDVAYNKAVAGLMGVDSAYDLGNSYMKQGGSIDKRIDSLVNWQTTKAATSGFVTGFGGILSMPLTIPANVASVMYIQVRMIAAIAYIGGHDLKSDKVKSLIYMCMVGNGAKELLKDASVKVGEKLISKSVEAISLKFASKAGGKAFTSLSKAIPIAGGIIGCSFDAASTKIVGNVAKRIFIDRDIEMTINTDEDNIVIN